MRHEMSYVEYWSEREDSINPPDIDMVDDEAYEKEEAYFDKYGFYADALDDDE
jgi:hypothetical protein